MYTLLESISPVSRLILLGSEPNISVSSFKLFSEIEISENLHSQILENAHRNSLLPLLFRNLKKHPAASGAFIEELKQQVLKGSLQLLKQEAVFRDLHQIFKENSIDFRVLKGFYLAREVYPEVYMRPMIDIDIMVQPTLINDVFELLKSRGYISYAIAEHKFISDHKHHPYGLKMKGVAIELHRSIFSDYDPVRIDESFLWDNALEFSFSGLKAKTLSTEVFLFHLCHHLMGHLQGDFIKLIWCRDIAEFIRVFEKKVDWDYFLHLYNISGATEELLHGLWFVNDWMNVVVPAKVLAKIKTPGVTIANDYIWFTEHKTNDKPRPHLITKFRQVEGWNYKVYFLLMKLFPVPGYLLRHYRKKKKINLIILYPYHFVRLISRGFRASVSTFYSQMLPKK